MTDTTRDTAIHTNSVTSLGRRRIAIMAEAENPCD